MSNTKDKKFKSSNVQDKPKVGISFKKPLTFFLIIASVILIMSVFFKIGKIDVVGNSVYSDKEIINASGIQKGDNLFFINRIAAGSRVVVKLPYVDGVTITRGLPNRVTIIVQESNAVGYVNVNGELWSVGSTGKCLNVVNKEDSAYMAEISGITVTTASVGEAMKTTEADKLEYLVEILGQLQDRGMIQKTTAIDISDVHNPYFEYDDRFTVKLGEHDNTEYKFGKFVAAMEELGDSASGTLDVSEENRVEYSPN